MIQYKKPPHAKTHALTVNDGGSKLSQHYVEKQTDKEINIGDPDTMQTEERGVRRTTNSRWK